MITNVNWNTVKPKFEDVEGKIVALEWNYGVLDIGKIITIKHYENITWSEVERYAILSEGAVCEWTKVPDNGAGHQETSCNHDFYGGEAGNCEVPHFTYCPFCANPIHIVDELKPLPLMGIEPILERSISGHYFYRWNGVNNPDPFQWEYTTPVFNTEREAIESWNSLVGKLTGEKWVNLIATKRNTKTM
jgi:hypothetical protein